MNTRIRAILVGLTFAVMSTCVCAEVPQFRQVDETHFALKGEGWCWPLPVYTDIKALPTEWTPMDAWAKYRSWSPMTDAEIAACREKKYYVAPNTSNPTRPLYDRQFNKIGTVSVGVECGAELVKPYSSTSKAWAWRPVAGGVAVCEER